MVKNSVCHYWGISNERQLGGCSRKEGKLLREYKIGKMALRRLPSLKAIILHWTGILLLLSSLQGRWCGWSRHCLPFLKGFSARYCSVLSHGWGCSLQDGKYRKLHWDIETVTADNHPGWIPEGQLCSVAGNNSSSTAGHLCLPHPQHSTGAHICCGSTRQHCGLAIHLCFLLSNKRSQGIIPLQASDVLQWRSSVRNIDLQDPIAKPRITWGTLKKATTINSDFSACNFSKH